MTEQVDQLAAIIRHVDGGNRLGAAALAEAILSHPDIGLVLANSDGPDWPARLRNCPTHGQQPPQAWGCPECVRQLREELAAARLHQPTLPAEGEVGDLVAWLNEHAAHLRKMQEIGALPETELQESLDRAAALLQQQEAEINRLRAQQAPDEREATAIEALKRLRQWGRLSGGGYSADVVLGVVDWIDGGMKGPLPPLPAHALPMPQGEVK